MWNKVPEDGSLHHDPDPPLDSVTNSKLSNWPGFEARTIIRSDIICTNGTICNSPDVEDPVNGVLMTASRLTYRNIEFMHIEYRRSHYGSGI